MKKWKNIMAMMLAMLMVMSTPMAVLAESEETVKAVAEAVQEMVAEEETTVVEEVPAAEGTSEAEETPAAEETPEVEETPAAEGTPEVEETPAAEGTPEAEETPAAEGTPEVEENPAAEEATVEKENTAALVSTQDAAVTASYSMFKVAESAKVNTYSDGSMTAEITYTGSSFLKMYLGTAAEAGAATEGFYEPVLLGSVTEDGKPMYRYVVPVESLDSAFNAAVLSSKGSWKDNTLTVSLVKAPETEEPENPGTDTEVLPAEGEYTINVTSNSSMFKVVNCVLTVKHQEMTAVITLSGTGYDKLFMGAAEEAAAATEDAMISYAADADGKYTFTIPVESLDKGIAVAAHSANKGTWYDRTLTFESATLKEYVNIPTDGEYTIDVTSNSAMFKVVNCVLTAKEQEMTAVITLSGTGYDKLFMGTAEEAAAATEDAMISYAADADGKYTFTIPVKSLDIEIPVAAHSVKKGNWLDRTLIFESITLKAVSDDDNKEDEKPEADNKDENAGVTGDEAIKDMIDSTSKGEVKDGTYKPSFGYKGGSGRTTLSCSKVVVKDGKATATIVFSSPNYTYMKVNGTKYYNTNKGGDSTFVVPVKLNGATTVYAETTAMSEAYEIEYTLYIYVDGTNVSNIKPAAQAKDEEEKSEETEDTETTEAVEEENSWGAFGSEQSRDEEETSEEEAAVASFSVSPVIPAVVVVVAVGAIAAFAAKKKSRKTE